MVHLTRRAWLALPAGCADNSAETPVASAANPSGPTGLVLFSLDFVAGARASLPNRSQLTVVEAPTGSPDPTGGTILRTLAGPGRASGSDIATGTEFCRSFAVFLPARSLALGRVFAEPTPSITIRAIFLLSPALVFTPRPGRALYLGNIAVMPHTWLPTRDPDLRPTMHRALRDMWARDQALFRAAAPALAGLPVDHLPPPAGWPGSLPPREAWPDRVGPAPRQDSTMPQYYGLPDRVIAPPGTPVRSITGPAPPPGFGPPGVAPGRFGRGAAQ